MAGNQKTAQSGKKHTLRNLIVILAVLLVAAFIAGFFIYCRTWRLFPNMPGIVDVMTGTDHFTRKDHVGLYEHGNNSDITGSGSQETDRLVLLKVNAFKYDLKKEPVVVDTTSFSTYSLYPCDKPADISLIFDKNDKLCCTEIVYHYTEDQMKNFDQEMNQMIYAVDRRFRKNALFSVYASLADKLGYKRYYVVRVGSAEDTQLVVQEFYRTKAYN
ncbi:MAG: hypothetical protein IKH27_05355 [Oscillospiraceae bacterium]|nr:hypothetical protein [Oscillospiraceae bacterium]